MAGHLSLTICDMSLLADHRRELQNLAQLATYTMSLLNSTYYFANALWLADA